MNDTKEGIRQKRPFLRRFILRDVQETLGNIKRTVSSRVGSKQSPRPEPPVERPSGTLPPYKELSLHNQATDDVLEKLNKSYFEQSFDAIDFELAEIQNQVGQEEVDAKVEQLTTALEVVSLQLSERVLEKHDHFVDGVEMVASIESDLQIALDLKQSLHYLYMETLERIDGALQAICTDFRSDEYKNILQCFLQQDITVDALSKKILNSFQDAITKASTSVVRSLLVTKPSIAEAMISPKFESTFSQLCHGLPFDLLRPCLAKLLEVLFDILCSYHSMSSWHVLGLKHAQSELTQLQSSPDEATQEDTESIQRSIAVLDSIHEILLQSRKVIWDSTARRVRDLLSGPAAVEGEHFLQVMEWCQKFLTAGEVFIGDRSELLRSIIAIQCGKFFQSYHSTNMDALEMLLKSEQFLNISINGLNSGIVSSLVSVLDQDDYEGLSSSDEVFDSWVSRGNPFRPGGHNGGFQEERKLDLTLGFGGASNMDDDHAAQVLEVDSRGFSNRSSHWTPEEAIPEDIELIGNESEEENPELFGEAIDEETQMVRMAEPTTSSNGEMSSNRTDYPLTNSAHQILKWLRNYCSLLRPLSSKSEVIFQGMADLFDAYFLDVFLFVGGISLHQLVWEEDLITTRLQSTLLRILTGEGHKYKEEIEKIQSTNPNLKATNSQMKFTLEIKSFTNRFNSSRGLNPSMPASNGMGQAPGGSPKWSALPNEQAALLSVSNMYGLRETVVAVGSIELLAKELNHAKSRIQSLLPVTSTRVLESYFTRTIDATADLRDCAFRNAARRILHEVFDGDKGIAMQIASTSYDTEEPSDTHNPWAHTLGQHIARFSELMDYAKLPHDVCVQLWEHALKTCSEVVLVGLSQVRKCTMTGRSMMSLDLSYVETSFRFMLPMEVHVNLRIVDSYIKAYYLPWEDLPKWVELNHAVYGKQKVVALFYLIVDRLNSLEGRNLKKAEIKTMLSEIESAMMQT
eukprot:g8169.t1